MLSQIHFWLKLLPCRPGSKVQVNNASYLGDWAMIIPNLLPAWATGNNQGKSSRPAWANLKTFSQNKNKTKEGWSQACNPSTPVPCQSRLHKDFETWLHEAQLIKIQRKKLGINLKVRKAKQRAIDLNPSMKWWSCLQESENETTSESRLFPVYNPF